MGGPVESVKHVLARRDRLFDSIKSATDRGVVLGGAGVARAAEAAATVLPPGCKYSAVYKSLLACIAEKPDSAAVREVCWALAADPPALRADRVVGPGQLPPDEAEVVVQFLAATRVAGRPGAAAASGFLVRYRAQILVGPGAPHVFEFVWSSRFVSLFAGRTDGLGFRGRMRANRPAAGRAYRHYSTLVGMRAVLTVAPGPRGVEVRGAKCPGGLRGHNQSLTEMRYRNGFRCPFDYEHHCQFCPKGQASCPAAVRPRDLVVRACRACGREAEHDPAWDMTVCVGCRADGRRPSGKV